MKEKCRPQTPEHRTAKAPVLAGATTEVTQIDFLELLFTNRKEMKEPDNS